MEIKAVIIQWQLLILINIYTNVQITICGKWISEPAEIWSRRERACGGVANHLGIKTAQSRQQAGLTKASHFVCIRGNSPSISDWVFQPAQRSSIHRRIISYTRYITGRSNRCMLSTSDNASIFGILGQERVSGDGYELYTCDGV